MSASAVDPEVIQLQQVPVQRPIVKAKPSTISRLKNYLSSTAGISKLPAASASVLSTPTSLAPPPAALLPHVQPISKLSKLRSYLSSTAGTTLTATLVDVATTPAALLTPSKPVSASLQSAAPTKPTPTRSTKKPSYNQPAWHLRWTTVRYRYLQYFTKRVPCLPSVTVGDVLFVTATVALTLMVVMLTGWNKVDMAHLMGRYATVLCGLMLLPITRHGLLPFLLNLPLNRSLAYHKYFAKYAVMVCTIHGVMAMINVNDKLNKAAALAAGSAAAAAAADADGDNPYDVYDAPTAALSPSLATALNDGSMGCNTTGLISLSALIAIMVISWQPIRRYTFNWFSITHQLLAVIFIVFGVIHYQWVIYILAAPIGLWVLDKLYRWYTSLTLSHNVNIVDMTALNGNVVRIDFTCDGFTYDAGQYIFVQIPSLSIYEWHPFSLSSSPHMPTLTLHIRNNGDWTGRLYEMVEKVQQQRIEWSGKRRRSGITLDIGRASPEDAAPQWPTMHISAAYGSTSIPLAQYQHFVFIAGGLGITPLQSIYNSLLNQHKTGVSTLKAAHFVWAVREKNVIATMNPKLQVSTDNHSSDLVPTKQFVPRSSIFMTPYVAVEQIPQPHSDVSLGMVVLDFGGPHSRQGSKGLHSRHASLAALEAIQEPAHSVPPPRPAVEPPQIDFNIYVTTPATAAPAVMSPTAGPFTSLEELPSPPRLAGRISSYSSATGSQRSISAPLLYPQPEIDQSHIHFGRPDLPRLFQQMGAAYTTETKVAVLVCGPDAMVSAVERLCVQWSNPLVTYHVHTESYDF